MTVCISGILFFPISRDMRNHVENAICVVVLLHTNEHLCDNKHTLYLLGD